MTAAPLDRTRLAFLPPTVEPAPQDFFIYGVEFLPLAANAVRQVAVFEVDEDHAFLIVAGAREYLTNADAIVANDQALANISFAIIGSGRGFNQATRPLLNDVPIDNWFGTGKNPCLWMWPIILPPNTRFQVALTNLEAVSRNYRISFIGCKLYRVAAMDPWAYFRTGW